MTYPLMRFASALLPRALRALLALFVTVCLAAAQAQPPDPATHTNVKDVQISGTNINKLEVNKNNTAKVKEIWKYNNNVWVKVWDLDNGGDYVISGNSSKQTKIQNNPTSESFTKDDKFRVVAEATDSAGNTTIIESITQG
jgi:hypothetical protein